MQLEKNDPIPGEPDDGWEKAPDLQSNEILSIALCKFTGIPITRLDAPCPNADRHPPVECRMLYHSSSALHRGVIDIAQYPADVPITEVRADNPSDDPIARISGG